MKPITKFHCTDVVVAMRLEQRLYGPDEDARPRRIEHRERVREDTRMHHSLDIPVGEITLRGRLYLPEDATGPVPVVIAHEGIGSVAEIGFPYAHLFTDAGLGVAFYDHRGLTVSSSRRPPTSVTARADERAQSPPHRTYPATPLSSMDGSAPERPLPVSSRPASVQNPVPDQPPEPCTASTTAATWNIRAGQRRAHHRTRQRGRTHGQRIQSVQTKWTIRQDKMNVSAGQGPAQVGRVGLEPTADGL